jgi:hypothetical protein
MRRIAVCLLAVSLLGFCLADEQLSDGGGMDHKRNVDHKRNALGLRELPLCIAVVDLSLRHFFLGLGATVRQQRLSDGDSLPKGSVRFPSDEALSPLLGSISSRLLAALRFVGI